MNISRVFAAAAIAAIFSFNSASAQTLKNGLVPAEFPPSSYKGRQYIDSDGCVFIRAGIDGNVTWVPRVTRSRKVICGFQPTFAKAAPAAKAPVAVAAAPKAKPRKKVRAKAPAAKPVRVAAAPQPVAQRGQPACRGGNAVSQQYVGRVGQGVRCGPQTGSFDTRTRRYDAQRGSYRQAAVTPERIVPRHVHESQVSSGPGITIPKGYKPAWDDDRLNPKRAHQTRSGKAQMEQIWSDTLPRQLLGHDAGNRSRVATSGDYVSVGRANTTMTVSTRSTSIKKSKTRKVQDR